MGFSANQARFLSLTSRQVDLEYRMQQICHRRIRLASELEKIATDYNNKMSDRELYAMNTAQSIDSLTLGNIRNMQDTNGDNYIVYYQNTTGSAITITDPYPTTDSDDVDTDGSGSADTDTVSDDNYSLANNAIISLTNDSEMATIIAAEGLTDKVPAGMSNLEYALRTGLVSIARVADTFTQKTINNTTDGGAIYHWDTTVDNNNFTDDDDGTAGNGGAGAFVAFQATSDSVGYEQMDWRTMTEIADELYKGNDVDAESEYENSIEKVNAQDKKLQLEQSQIEVEHKAIVTQKDSVKSIIDKNIEKSFKTFG